MSPLGNASAEECANYCIALFSDLTRNDDDAELVSRWGILKYGNELQGYASV